MKFPPINYVRLERESTDSWITWHLPKPMRWEDEETYEALIEFLRVTMPGWDLVSACVENPDDEEVQANERWPE